MLQSFKEFFKVFFLKNKLSIRVPVRGAINVNLELCAQWYCTLPGPYLLVQLYMYQVDLRVLLDFALVS